MKKLKFKSKKSKQGFKRTSDIILLKTNSDEFKPHRY